MNKKQYVVITVIVLAITAGLIAAWGSKTRKRHPINNAGAQTCAVGQDCCRVLPASATKKSPLKMTTNSGLPCIVLFFSNEVKTCKEAQKTLTKSSSELKGKADVLKVDTEVFPAECRHWRLRIVPTLLILDEKGKEITRTEGVFSRSDLSSMLREAGIL